MNEEVVNLYRWPRTTLFILLIYVMSATAASASWAFAFVVHDGKTYALSNDTVSKSLLGGKIGQVSYYSDEEGSYGGNFSNALPKGTPYFRIQGTPVEQAITVQNRDGTYVKAYYQGQHSAGGDNTEDERNSPAGTSYSGENFILPIILFVLVGTAVAIVFHNKLGKGK
ncbi:hypothetical protein [Paenibacillus sp. SN-8-1]|uniref:hypothetical protein n=1 Tax=Paenibacillus sp. SN-8-1 TaxID=3435409 RepID=UPI003D9A5215